MVYGSLYKPMSRSSKKNVLLQIFIGLTVFLTVLGSLAILDVSGVESFQTFGTQYHFFQQHLYGVGAGLVLMLITSFFPLKVLLKHSFVLFCAALALCVAVFIPGIGLELNGAHSWLSLGPVVFQPVEALKLASIVYFSYLLSFPNKHTQFFVLAGVAAGLIILQPDLGSLSVVVVILGAVYFLSGGSVKHMLLFGGIAIGLAAIAIFSSSYRYERLKTFLDPSSDPLGSSFHYRQLVLSLGRGGILGQGIGKSNQKYAYVPEASTDSIFAILAEEIGFVGSTLIVLLFLYYFYVATTLILRSSATDVEKVVGMSIVVWIATQTLLNLGAVVGLIPLTGAPLPFFSYGRSALVMVLCATGFISNIGRKT